MLEDDFIQNFHDLPTLPAVALQINQEMLRANLTSKSLAVIISSDPALAAKVLRLANSAYYGLSRKVDTLDRAITILGFNTIKNIALTISVFNIFKDYHSEIINLEDLWHHSLGCAVAAKSIAAVSNSTLSEHAFLAGIIHDIGKIAMIRSQPGKMYEILAQLQNNERSQSNLELDIMGFTHQQIGYRLAEKWNFPESYCQAIRLHHTPQPSQSTANEDDLFLVNAVYVGNNISKAMSLGASTDRRHEIIDPTTWQSLKIERDQIGKFRELIQEDYETIIQHWEK